MAGLAPKETDENLVDDIKIESRCKKEIMSKYVCLDLFRPSCVFIDLGKKSKKSARIKKLSLKEGGGQFEN